MKARRSQKKKRPVKTAATEALPLFRAWLEGAMRSGTGKPFEYDLTESSLGVSLSLLVHQEEPNVLVEEWSKPVTRVVQLLAGVLLQLEVYSRKDASLASVARVRCETLAQQLDFALTWMSREINGTVRYRAHRTGCIDLLLHALGTVQGDGVEAAALIERIQKDHPEVDRLDNGCLEGENTVDTFAWETYQRVAALDRLVDCYPEHARWAARQMHAWPTLRSLHHSNDIRFRELAKKLELGRDYPLDASEAARFRPDTPMVRLLDPLLVRLCHLREHVLKQGGKFQFTAASLCGHWGDSFDEEPNEMEIQALQRLSDLPSLNKSSAKVWATQVVVPVILATHNTQRGQCTELVLRNIWQHRAVKSSATFRSRLEAAVISYLRRMARREQR